MPRSRPGKKERAVKRIQDQRALDELNDRIQAERTSKKQLPEETPGKPRSLHTTNGDNRITKAKPDRTYTSSEVDAIVQAAVTAAVSTTVAATKALLTGEVPKQSTTVSKPATLAERITSKKTLADRISFPKKN
jgi:hypothetical protein